jgi:hypothetical protein
LQYPIQVKSLTLHSASITYCDFQIELANKQNLFVAAKEKMTPEALLKLKLLEVVFPEYRDHLIIVSQLPQYYFGKRFPPSLNLAQFIKRLPYDR